jgi:hypothetical protein
MNKQKQVLYKHLPYSHEIRNVNDIHAQERIGFNARLATFITKSVSTMWAAYIFTFLAFIGLFGLLGWLNPFVFLFTTWLSQQFLQLVFLPILAVGQNVLSRHQELQAEETYKTTIKIYEYLEVINKKLEQIEKA